MRKYSDTTLATVSALQGAMHARREPLYIKLESLVSNPYPYSYLDDDKASCYVDLQEIVLDTVVLDIGDYKDGTAVAITTLEDILLQEPVVKHTEYDGTAFATASLEDIKLEDTVITAPTQEDGTAFATASLQDIDLKTVVLSYNSDTDGTAICMATLKDIKLEIM